MRIPLRNTVPLVVAGAMVGLLAACSSASTPVTNPAPASVVGSSAAAGSSATGATLTIANFAFSPVTVAAGQTVTVVNQDSVDHTVTIADISVDVKAPAGQTVTFTAPSAPGTYRMTCDVHPDMKGILLVTK